MTGQSLQGISRFMRGLSAVVRRRKLMPAIELTVSAWLMGTMIVSYLLLTGGHPGEDLLTPPLAGLLLVANLIPAIVLLVLLGRRIAYTRAAKSPLRGTGKLHSRLVALFSTIAAIPVLLLVIFASLLFQYGFDFWYSKEARGIFENANSLAQTYYQEKQRLIINEAEVMAGDLNLNMNLAPIESDEFSSGFGYQVLQRSLSEGAILRITSPTSIQALSLVNPYKRPQDHWVPSDVAQTLLKTRQTVFRDSGNRMEAVTPIPGRSGLFLYASRVDDDQSGALAQTKRFSSVLRDYNNLLDRSRTLQLQFHGALFIIALIVVGAAVAIALNVADRVVQPIGELVDAARRVSGGDLSARVATSTRAKDEIGTLGAAFNQMTQRLEKQRTDLTDANYLLDRRRALIEAVLGAVTAGVIAVGPDGVIRIVNNRAGDILQIDPALSLGGKLTDHAPEFAELLATSGESAVIEIHSDGERRTLAVRRVSDVGGQVITLDDITDQLADQRRAAWSDVARRIAHEIKNPLTPIQLAAERLRRRFSRNEPIDPATVDRLTDTIIRQVGDLRRMVDEFSSFARMPKPVFQEESLVDICRQALFLQEVANSAIRFEMNAPDIHPLMVCDRRQLGQAFTNIIKNAVEAIEQRPHVDGDDRYFIILTVDGVADGKLEVRVEDTGIGLPAERDRIVEPYMTTRKSGTGLGLAIVKKIIEEHAASINFADRIGGGTIVTVVFNPAEMAILAQAEAGLQDVTLADEGPAALTRTETV
jgi:two-component system, NtrC family, nitrogen regulation sensor histidine kinase NtrY